MQKVKIQRKKDRQQTASISSKNIKRRTTRQRKFNNRRTRQSNYSNVHLYATHYINSISSLKVDYQFKKGIFEDNDNIIKMIKDIYPVIYNNIPVYEIDNFNENTKPIDFLNWILDRYLNTSPPGEKWTIFYNKDIDKFLIEYIYEYDDIGIEGRSAPISFLLTLEKENKKLYELFIAYLHHVNKAINIPIYSNDYHYDDTLVYLEDDIEEMKNQDVDAEYAEEHLEDLKIKEEDLKCYKEGNAFRIGQEITHCKISKNLLLETLKNYKVKKKIHKAILKLIKDNINLLHETEYKLNDFYLNNEDDDEELSSAMFDQWACIIWSLDDSVFNFMEQMYNDTAGNYGVIPFRIENTKGINNKIPDLPNRWINFLDELMVINNLYSESP